MATTNTKSIISTAASLAATAVLVRTITNDLIPTPLRDRLHSAFAALLPRFSSRVAVVIEEFDGLHHNQVYKAAETYLGTRVSPSARRLRVTKNKDSRSFEIGMDREEDVIDVYQGIQFRWRLICYESKSRPQVFHGRGYHMDGGATTTVELRYFELSFHKRNKGVALGAYLTHVLERAKAIKEDDKALKIHTLKFERMHGDMRDVWAAVKLDHPATFDTLAMEPELKKTVMDDLERFVSRKEYYRRVGKAWKRGYLLYGPPGTGKSSLIGAMANLLRFDVYDLELTEVQSNSQLRTLLVATANRSILVVEDIDCMVELQERKEADRSKAAAAAEMNVMNVNRFRGLHGYNDDKVTLSGLLNFIDGLWSSCGDERIIVFTTNHKDRLDPALLRPGRMDMHIHMSYCTPKGFDTLLSNYHGVESHPLESEIEALLGEVQTTPAEVAEELMKSDDVGVALSSLVKFLHGKKDEAFDQAKAGEPDEKVEEGSVLDAEN